MGSLGWMMLSFLALVFIVYHENNQNKMKRLQKQVKRLAAGEKGVNDMSALLQEFVGKKCVIILDDSITGLDNWILEAYDEQLAKLTRETKKGQKVKLIRVDDIKTIQDY